MSVASLRDDDGNTLGAVTVGRDITGLQIAEQELRRSEERYRDILDNASDLVFLVDQHGKFTYANPSFFRTLGYNGTSLLETNLQSITSLDNENWAESISGTNKELVFKKQDGTPVEHARRSVDAKRPQRKSNWCEGNFLGCIRNARVPA